MLSVKVKILFGVLSFAVLVLLTFFLITIFGLIENVSDVSSSILVRLCVIHFSLTILVILSWLCGIPILTGVTIAFSSLLVFFTTIKTTNSFFLIFVGYYVSCYVFLFREMKRRKELLVMDELEKERIFEEKNVLEQAFNDKAQSLDVFLHKYSDYSNLRGVIDDLSSTLSLNKVCNLIVSNALNVISKGELVLLYLVDIQESSLSLFASKSVDSRRRKKFKKGDIFDQWVMKNMQQLFVQDIRKDVRFDLQLSNTDGNFRSLMVTPLVYDFRVVGTLRINSEVPNIFTTDDLRVLTIIGNISSAALSNAFLYKKTEELAIRDSLTGLFVHRYFQERLNIEHQRALLMNSSLTLLMCDLDDFKKYNDRYGHAAGDIILKRVSAILEEIVGENGFVSRYGGEEFTVLLPLLDKKDAQEMAETVRAAVASEKFELRGANTGITISIGIASMPEDSLDGESLIKLSDRKLYEAKKAGKNVVV